jgi:hypothetical protein
MQATKKRRSRGAFRIARLAFEHDLIGKPLYTFPDHALVMPEQCQQQNDRQRHAKQPKQSTSSKAHDVLLLIHCADDAAEKKKFRASRRGGMRSVHGLKALCAPVFTGDDFDLAAAVAGEGQELFDRQRIRDPFGKALGACSLIFEILDRVQAPASPKARFVWAAMVLEKRLTAG